MFKLNRPGRFVVVGMMLAVAIPLHGQEDQPVEGRIVSAGLFKNGLAVIHQVIEVINPILRGWVRYFAVGHSSRCFSFVCNWVVQKIRRHLARARQRQGFGWKRWSSRGLYDGLGLFNEYRVGWPPATKASPA